MVVPVEVVAQQTILDPRWHLQSQIYYNRKISALIINSGRSYEKLTVTMVQ